MMRTTPFQNRPGRLAEKREIAVTRAKDLKENIKLFFGNQNKS